MFACLYYSVNLLKWISLQKTEKWAIFEKEWKYFHRWKRVAFHSFEMKFNFLRARFPPTNEISLKKKEWSFILLEGIPLQKNKISLQRSENFSLFFQGENIFILFLKIGLIFSLLWNEIPSKGIKKILLLFIPRDSKSIFTQKESLIS